MRMLRRELRLVLPWLAAVVVSGCGWVDAGVSEGAGVSGVTPLVVGEGEALAVDANVLGDGETGRVLLVRPPAHALEFDLSEDGDLTYVHDGSETTEDSFVYALEEAGGNGPERTVTITVAPRNDPPVTTDLAISVVQGGTAVDTVLATDPDDTQLVYSASRPSWGTVRLDPANGEFTYSAARDYVGADEFVVTVADPAGASAASRVQVQVAAAPGPPPAGDENHPPAIDPVEIVVNEDETASVLLAVGDPDGDALTYSVTPPEHGIAAVDSKGVLTYTPSPDYSGSDRFDVTVEDGRGGSDSARVSVTVRPVADPPAAEDDRASVAEDGTTEAKGNLLSNDVGPGIAVSAMGGAGSPGKVDGKYGTVEWKANGEYTYRLDNGLAAIDALDDGERVEDTFDYTVRNTDGTDTARLRITVDGHNDAPLASNDGPYWVRTGGERDIDVTALLDNDSDPEKPKNALSIVLAKCPQHGRLTGDGGDCPELLGRPLGAGTRLTYRHDGSGDDRFTYRASDGTSTSAVAAQVAIKINAPPVADDDCWDFDDDWDNDDRLSGFVVASDTESPSTLSYSVTVPPQSGTVELDSAAGTFTYRPKAGSARGLDSFKVAVEDSLGDSAEATVTVISPVRIMPLGDSITAGVVAAAGPPLAEQVGYRMALRELIATAGYGVDFVGSLSSGASRFSPTLVDAEHEGHSGWRDEQLAVALSGIMDANPADMVLLHIGTNGLEPNAGDVATILDGIAQRAALGSPPTAVFLARIIDQNPKDANGFVDAFNRDLESVAAARRLLGQDVTVVDMQRALWDGNDAPDPALYGDTLHPNDAGYRRMAETWFDALAQRLHKCDHKRHP